MYIPSPLPTTRLSISTSALPYLSPLVKIPTFKAPLRPNGKGKFTGRLGGVLEEEGEEIIGIARAIPNEDDEIALWSVLGREEVSIWFMRPKVVLAKIRRTPLSLRSHGSNASLLWHSSSSFIITTTSGHHLLYSISNYVGSRGVTTAYVLPGGEKAVKDWPNGPGEGKGLLAMELKGEGERGMGVGDGVGCVCSTSHSLLVSVLDPPSLRIVPYPTLSPSITPHPVRSSNRNANTFEPGPEPKKGNGHSGWEALNPGVYGGAETEAVVLDEWDWLVGGASGEVTISKLIEIPSDQDETSAARPDHPFDPLFVANPAREHQFIMLTSDGRGYLVHWGPPPYASSSLSRGSTQSSNQLPPVVAEEEVLFDEKAELKKEREAEANRWLWSGVCFHPCTEEKGEEMLDAQDRELDKGKGASEVDLNLKMGLIAVGCEDGTISAYNISSNVGGPARSSFEPICPTRSHEFSLRKSLNSTATGLATGRVTCLSWTSDGYALAVGWNLGWSIWSVYGRLGSWSVEGSLNTGYGVEGDKSESFEDHFMNGVKNLFWSPGNLELYVLCPPPIHPKGKSHDEQLFIIPFAKSAVTGLHSPDNTKHAFLQMDDRVLVYRGGDQPDMSVINPDSDVWQHIKIPAAYIALQHPIQYAVISADARLIAVAGRKGLTHYNAISGRWKLFDLEKEEDSLRVVGGMAWWGNILIVGCEEGGFYQIRLFSREKNLSLGDSLEVVGLSSKPLLLSIFDSSLLVYTEDNTFHHFLIRQGKNGMVKLRMCGSIGFEGVVADPRKVRGMSWLVPKSQQLLGDPADDLNVATIIFLIAGQLVLLRPRRAAHEEVKYDLQILADRIEFYWTHLSGIGTLENSLWGFDGQKIRIWLNALTIEKVKLDEKRDKYEEVEESVAIGLDFYPLAVLMDKGIIVGIDHETSLRRSLDFAIFRIITSTHLFIHHVLQYHLTKDQKKEAVLFASYYQHLVYFAHSLEILLYVVLEDEVDEKPAEEIAVLPRVIEFLDHFDEALQVVVGCARKTEVSQWGFLFDVVGKPRDLFEKCVSAGLLKIAASYLLILHNLEPVEQSSKDTIRLLKSAIAAREWTLCRELLSFLHSIDRSGAILRAALAESGSTAKMRSNSTPSDISPSIIEEESISLGMKRQQSLPNEIGGLGLGFGSLLERVGLHERSLSGNSNSGKSSKVEFESDVEYFSSCFKPSSRIYFLIFTDSIQQKVTESLPFSVGQVKEKDTKLEYMDPIYLPPEIIIQICQEIARGIKSSAPLDPPERFVVECDTLSAASRITSDWMGPARAQLFKRIIIRNSAHLKSVSAMKSTQLRSYVIEISLDLKRLDGRPQSAKERENVEPWDSDTEEAQNYINQKVTKSSLRDIKLLLSNRFPRLTTLQILNLSEQHFTKDIAPLLAYHPSIRHLSMASERDCFEVGHDHSRNGKGLNWSNLDTLVVKHLNMHGYLEGSHNVELVGTIVPKNSSGALLITASTSPDGIKNLIPILQSRANGHYALAPGQWLKRDMTVPELARVFEATVPYSETTQIPEDAPHGALVLGTLSFVTATPDSLRLLIMLPPTQTISFINPPPRIILNFLKTLRRGDLRCKGIILGWSTRSHRSSYTRVELESIAGEIAQELMRLEVDFMFRSNFSFTGLLYQDPAI